MLLAAGRVPIGIRLIMLSAICIMITLLVALAALMAIPWPAASGVFDKLLPLLTLILGYFFGHHAS
jgi:hypothetical protein